MSETAEIKVKPLPGEGETITVLKTRVRIECVNCGEPATKRNTYLMPSARINPNSTAYGHDDCTWCSDHDQFVCDACDKADYEDDVPAGYKWCSTFTCGDRFAHMFLRWHERELKSL